MRTTKKSTPKLKRTIKSVAPSWGFANEKRGMPMSKHAEAFIKQHPIGSVLTRDDFDDFFLKRGLPQPRTSLERNNRRYALNKAGLHPRLLDRELPTFTLAVRANNQYVVRTPEEAAKRSLSIDALLDFFEYRQRKATYALQGMNGEKMDPKTRQEIEHLYDTWASSQQMILAAAHNVQLQERRVIKLLPNYQKLLGSFNYR